MTLSDGNALCVCEPTKAAGVAEECQRNQWVFVFARARGLALLLGYGPTLFGYNVGVFGLLVYSP